MKIKLNLYSIIIVSCILFLPQVLNAQSDGYKTKTVDVQKGGNLEMKVLYGDIIVTTWDKNQVLVKYEYDEDTGEAISVVKSGNTVTITSNQEANSDQYELSIPSNFNINLITQGGNIDLRSDLTGTVKISTAGGDITLKKVNGDVKLSTAGGNIRTGDLRGKIELKTAGGDIKLGTVGIGSVKTAGGNIYVESSEKSLKIHTAGGNVKIGNVGGEIEILTGGGNVNVGTAKGSAILKSGGGNISLNGASGKVEVKTGGGNIGLTNISGSVEAKTGAGDVNLELNPAGNTIVKTAYGNITLFLSPDAKATVVALVRSSTWMDESDKGPSDITSDFPATTFDKKGSGLDAVYQINGGGDKIELVTQSGKIDIKKKNK